MAVFLGIDVGGSKTALACVHLPSAQIVDERVMPTPHGEAAAAAFVDAIVAVATGMAVASRARGEAVGGIGLGVCELVGPDGRINSTHRLPWGGLDVAGRLATVAPAVIESDVRAAAMAEARYGAGAHADPLYYLNIGTGISGCLVEAGKAYRGARGNALVVASMASDQLCDHCSHRQTVNLEERYGGSGIVDSYRRAGFPETHSALQVLAAAAAGEPAAERIVATAARAIGARLGLVIDLFDPAKIVVGGGIAAAAGPFWPQLVAATRANIWAPETRALPIERAAFGARSGVIGAAIAASEFLETSNHLSPAGGAML